MKVVVGVDLGGVFKPGLELLKRLSFPETNVCFVNAVEPVMPDGTFPELVASNPISLIINDLLQAGREAVARVSSDWPGSTVLVSLGSSAGCILGAASDQSADMIVVGSQQKSIFESLFVGSVTKALATQSKQAVLIGKRATKSEDGLVVVLAHDMSEYSDKAVEKLIAFGPKGISRIVLVTADTTDPSIVAVVERQDPKMAGETLDLIESLLENHQNKIAARLKTICPNVETVLSQGKAIDVINSAMAAANADVLILGAQGHGFLERLVIGSVALHHVVREHHNVLILRA